MKYSEIYFHHLLPIESKVIFFAHSQILYADFYTYRKNTHEKINLKAKFKSTYHFIGYRVKGE